MYGFHPEMSHQQALELQVELQRAAGERRVRARRRAARVPLRTWLSSTFIH